MKSFALFLSAAIGVLLGAVSPLAAAPGPLDHLIQALHEARDSQTQLNILRGMNAAFRGRRNVPPPAGWDAAYARLSQSEHAEVRQQAQALAVALGGGAALEELRKTLADAKATLDARTTALNALVQARDAASIPPLLVALRDPGPFRRAVLRALPALDDAAIPKAILDVYPVLESEQKQDALAALAARGSWARGLIKAVDEGRIARADLAAPVMRQLQNLHSNEINDWVRRKLGTVRETSEERRQEIARFKKIITPAAIEKADLSHGRAVFAQACAVCHTLFGAGGQIGPELPGAFEDVDYLLQNILDPNAVIGKDYQQTTARLKNGQVLVGVITAEDDSAVTLKTLAGPVVTPRGEIAEMTVSEQSLMPEGLLAPWKDGDVIDLFAYLRRHGQVPLLLSTANAADFFNGTDLAKWIVSRKDAWSVESGTIRGQGNAQRRESLISDLAGGDFRLTLKLQHTGGGQVDLILRGQYTDGGFEGRTLRLGDHQAKLLEHRPGQKPAVLAAIAPLHSEAPGWKKIEIVAQGSRVHVQLGDHHLKSESTLGGSRTVPGFFIDGAGATLQIKSLKIEPLP